MENPNLGQNPRRKQICRVQRIEVVSTFRLDEAVVLSVGPRLQALQRRFGGEILTLNVPRGAPPDLPRVALVLKNTLLHVGLTRFQFIMEPPGHVRGSFYESMEFARSRVTQMLPILYRGKRPHHWTGAIAGLAYPSDLATTSRGVDAAATVFSRLLKLDWDPGSLAGLKIEIGREQRGYFKNYVLSGYEETEIRMPVPPKQRFVRVNVAQGELKEVGLGIQIDVNNRPMKGHRQPISDMGAVLDELTAAYESLPEDLNLEGIV
jgi:hypothetical protein